MDKISDEAFYILDGPSRSTLFEECKNAHDGGPPDDTRSIFVVSTKKELRGKKGRHLQISTCGFCVTGIKHSDGSGRSFIVRGTCKAGFTWGHEDVEYHVYSFRAVYNTTEKNGVIFFKKGKSNHKTVAWQKSEKKERV